MPDKTTLIIFEDAKADRFYPIAVSHPVFDLLNGCFNPVERFQRLFKPAQIILVCREYLAESAQERHKYVINEIKINGGQAILINAAIRPDPKFIKEIMAAKRDKLFYNGDCLLGGKLSVESAKKYIREILDLPANPAIFGDGSIRAESKSQTYNYLWDLINDNCKMIETDCSLLAKGKNWTISAKGKAKEGIYIHKSAHLAKGAHIDDTLGPVIVDEEAFIEARSVIQGPSYIGKGSRLMGGIIREGCSLGPVCKVGGELEESIILGYSNKCHEGFIGHSYIGEWVNLGALSTNSDLKNNYSPVRVTHKGKEINTNSLKIGSFIGDHTKTGIGTLFNTGIVIGFCCNLYGGMLFQQKEIPHFSWGTPDSLVGFKLEKAIQIAETAMARRGQVFTEAQRALFVKIKQSGQVN